MPSGKTVAAGGLGGLVALSMSIAVPNIKELEGRRNTPYYDVVKVLTVCDGHTGKDVVIGKVYNDKECNQMTLADAKTHTDSILKTSPQLAWHPMILASMISFDYNTGAYHKSTVAVLFNKGDFVGGCNFLSNYNKPKQIIGRRAKEKALCLSTLTPQGLKDV